MFDAQSPAAKAVVQELEKPGVRDKLVQFARMLTGSAADAQDLVAEAVVRMCDPDEGRPWDGTVVFGKHARRVIREVARGEWDSARRKHEFLDADDLVSDSTADRDPLPDAQVVRRRRLELHRKLGALVRERVSDDPVTVAVFDHGREGIEPDVLANAVGRSVEEIYAHIRKLKYHGRQVMQQWQEAEQRRMKELRERAERERLAKQEKKA